MLDELIWKTDEQIQRDSQWVGEKEMKKKEWRREKKLTDDWEKEWQGKASERSGDKLWTWRCKKERPADVGIEPVTCVFSI